jgi:transposase
VFRKELQALCADPKAELWFGDESGIEGDPRPRRRWVQPGQPRTVPYLGDHLRQNVIGAVAPQSGELFTLIVDGVDTDVFQCFLDEMAKAVPKKEGLRLILDNASWHKSKGLNWHHFEPKFLPGSSPDFNPIERLWLRLKADWFWDFIARTEQELTDRLSTAIQSFLAHPDKTASICSIRK